MITGNSVRTDPRSKGANDKINVMVVDDALVIRGMLTRFMEESGDIDVIASVGDGERALTALDRYDVDVVVLDIEMPRMDGLTALPKIIEKCPHVQVIMASTLTLRNAGISMKAMNLGAADYVAKPTSSGELHSADNFKRELVDKVRALGGAVKRRRLRRAGLSSAAAPRKTAGVTARERPTTGRANVLKGMARQSDDIELRPAQKFIPDVITIGSSTGGPQALFKVLKNLGTNVKQPILITQHMPPTFTTILAEHVGKASGLPTVEASDGAVIEGGHIYIAPGDFHMLVESKGVQKVIKLTQDPPENFCRPAVDPMLRSVVKSYGSKILTVILTGMGSDGCKGSQAVVDAGGNVIAQDEETSVVWGMPGAVSTAGICSAILPLDEVGAEIKKIAVGG